MRLTERCQNEAVTNDGEIVLCAVHLLRAHNEFLRARKEARNQKGKQ